MTVTKAFLGAMLGADEGFGETRWLALFVDDPVTVDGEVNSSATELDGGLYVRKELSAAQTVVSENQVTVTLAGTASGWFDANDNVTGDPGFMALCSNATRGNLASVLWSAPLSPDIAAILNGTSVSIQPNAVTFIIPVR